jgi:hypothetical protein
MNILIKYIFMQLPENAIQCYIYVMYSNVTILTVLTPQHHVRTPSPRSPEEPDEALVPTILPTFSLLCIMHSKNKAKFAGW